MRLEPPLGPNDSPRVVLEAANCSVRGSELVESLRLDERFTMRFATTLTWAPVYGTPGAPGRIVGAATLDVWSEIIPPFNLMPRPMLEASCNVVIAGLVNSLLPLFMRRLADDYAKWAASAEYRAQRASRRVPLSA